MARWGRGQPIRPTIIWRRGAPPPITRAPSDTLGLTDSHVITRAIGITVTDTLGLTDSRATARTIVISRTDTLSLTDSRATARTIVVSRADTLGLTDTRSRGLGVVRSDTLGLTDTRAAVRGIAATVADTLGVSGIPSKVAAWARTVADTLGITGTTSSLRTTYVNILDPLDLSDIAFRPTEDYEVDVDDTIGLTDSHVADAMGQSSPASTISLTDYLTVEREIHPTITDTMNVGARIGLNVPSVGMSWQVRTKVESLTTPTVAWNTQSKVALATDTVAWMVSYLQEQTTIALTWVIEGTVSLETPHLSWRIIGSGTGRPIQVRLTYADMEVAVEQAILVRWS